MNKTTKQTIEVDVPVGWRIKEFARVPPRSQGLHYLQGSCAVKQWFGEYGSSELYVILEPDPSYIDTTSEEYRVEVYRQWLRGKRIQRRAACEDGWVKALAYPGWNWEAATYRREPTGTDELGPYYLDGTKKVYVPK